MAINSSIAMGVQPMKIEGPADNYGKMLTLKSLLQQSQQGEMAMQDAQEARQQKTTLADLYKTATSADGSIDRKALFTGAAQRGLGAQIPGLQKTFNEQDKAQRDAEKAQIESHLQKLDLGGRLLSSAKDQASYEAARQSAQAAGLDVSRMPPQFDPAFVQAKLDESMDVKTRLEQTWKQKGYDLDVAKFGYQKTKDFVEREQQATRYQKNYDQKERELAGDTQPSGGGSVLGAPVPAVSPWANQSNSKDANKVKASESSRGAKELEKDADGVTAAKESARDAERFMALNAKMDTGGLSDKNAIGRWSQSFSADYADMQAIAAKLTPAMRTPGSGTTSDADLALFKQATVGVDKPKKTNDNIARAYMARAEQMEQYADFRQTYLEQNGTLSGAERHWKEYLNKNPIFDPAKKDSFELNASRQPWREHFKAGAAPVGDKKPAGKTVVRTGTLNGRKVVQYSDGSTDYAN